MWDKILNQALALYMTMVTGKDGDRTEDATTISYFFDHVKTHVKDYKVVIVMATEWDKYEEAKQVGIAIHYVGEHHASRFIIMMDYLNQKFKKGELK